MAPLLVKFWALYGITQFATELLSVYLAPFQTVWLISTLRAIILIVLLLGRRLQISETLYDSKLHPFYDSQAPEIERQLARTHQHWEDLNAAFRQLAKQILERVAMGGLSAILPIPSSHEAHSHTTSQHAPTSTSGKQSTAAPLPRESAPFPIDRQFFAGEPERRAETLRQSRNDNLRGAIQVAIPEPPKAAYENSRVLRQMFRHRSKSKMHQKGLPS